MPTLRNSKTGAVVSCSPETAARLGAEWKPVEKPAETKTTRRKTSSRKSD